MALATQVASMRLSRSAPSLATRGGAAGSPALGSSLGRQTIAHRGSHDIGAVMGVSNSDTYVPRAQWTESADSPMKHRTVEFDPHLFMAQEAAKNVRKQRQKDLLKTTHYSMMDSTVNMDHGDARSMTDFRRLVDADVNRSVEQERAAREGDERKRKQWREKLTEQVGDMNRRAHENRLREAHEAAELKARTAQALLEEMAERSRRRDVAKKDAEHAMRTVDAKSRQLQADKELEAREFHKSMRDSFNADEYKLAAQKQRLREAQSHAEGCEKMFTTQVFHREEERRRNEDSRQDNDEKLHNTRMDLHYATREHLRKRQQQRVVQTLDNQKDAATKRKELERSLKKAERDAVNESTRRNLDMELDRSRIKRAEEVQLQRELVAMMQEKQQREKQDGVKRAPNMATMHSPVRGSAGTPADLDLSKSIEAARHVDKPLGRVEVKPWLDIRRSAGIGGIVGAFAGEGGHTKMALQATGGPGRILTKSAAIIQRDQLMASGWSEGLSPKEVKAGREAALRRQAAERAGRSDAI